MKTSKLFTEIINTEKNNYKIKAGICPQSGAFSTVLLLKGGLQWCASSFIRISKLQFRYYFTRMEGTTNTWLLHYCMIFKTRSSHSLTLWTFMKYSGAVNVYVDTQPKFNIHKTYPNGHTRSNPRRFDVDITSIRRGYYVDRSKSIFQRISTSFPRTFSM